MWADDGFVIRFPETDEPPASDLLLPEPEEVRALVTRQVASSSLFAARFRENAGRSLLLPKRRPGLRAPLWQQRKRAASLLQVASKFQSFPVILETYRECLTDVFDLSALVEVCRSIRNRSIRVEVVDVDRPSPFATALLFRYVANYLYDGDAPLAERRAQALAVDLTQLRELIGEIELRDLLDSEDIKAVESSLQGLGGHPVSHEDGLHDLLLRVGDLSGVEIASRCAEGLAASLIENLLAERRIIEIRVGGETRLIAAEDAARYRDALGCPLPSGLPERFLEETRDAVGTLIARWARTHGPFLASRVAGRFGLGRGIVVETLERLALAGRLIEGEFSPNEEEREWCDADVLRRIRNKSLARLRKEVEPVDGSTFARFLLRWHGIGSKRRGLDSLLDVIESLQGFPLPASILETEILPSRIEGYLPGHLDTLFAAGEIVWMGLEPIGGRDGRIALYLTDQLVRLRIDRKSEELDESETQILEFLGREGASFFQEILDGIGGGFPGDVQKALWSLVWRGLITNDSFHPLRSLSSKRRGRKRSPLGFRSRRRSPQSTEGRWSLLTAAAERSEEEHRMSLAQQWLVRHGVVCRDVAGAEPVNGGFSAVYPVLRTMEESGRIRRGYFVGDVAAMQFATPGAIDLLRDVRDRRPGTEVRVISACDPANPWGIIFRWPERRTDVAVGRFAGASIILVDGALGGWISRGGGQVVTWIPEEEPDRSRVSRGVADGLVQHAESRGLASALIVEIDGQSASEHSVAGYLREAGFAPTAKGMQWRLASQSSKKSGV